MGKNFGIFVKSLWRHTLLPQGQGATAAISPPEERNWTGLMPREWMIVLVMTLLLTAAGLPSIEGFHRGSNADKTKDTATPAPLGALFGTVTCDGVPQANVQVFAGRMGRTARSATSNSAGKYHLVGIQEGALIVFATRFPGAPLEERHTLVYRREVVGNEICYLDIEFSTTTPAKRPWQ